MKRVRFVFPVILIALAFGFYACQKDNTKSSSTGNSNLGIKLQALNKSFSLPVTINALKSADVASSTIVWDTAHMVVSSVKFESKLKGLKTHHDSILISYTWKGPIEVNLLDTTVSIGNFTLQPGFYDEIEFMVEGTKRAVVNKPVFYLHGVYTKADVTKLPIKVVVNEDILFKTEKDSVTVTAADQADFTSAIQLYLDQLMVDLLPSTLDNATLTNGVLVISAESNKELYRIILRNLIKNHHCRHSHKHGNGMMH